MLRGALIGAGNAAIDGHLPAYLHDAWLQKKVEIVAAADLAEGNLALLQARMPSLKIHRSAAKLLAAEELDFIDICAPPHVHPYLIRLASQRGCHILCEQPLALDLAEGLEIQRCVAARRIVFMPCHQYRFSPLWRTVSQLVHEDQIGHIHLAQFEVFRLHADQGNEQWIAGWRTDHRIGGGGIIFDIGTKGNIELRGDAIVLQREENRREWLIEGASGKAAFPQWYGQLFREFVYKIETASYSTELLEEAATALRYAELCYRSAKTGKIYRFSDEKT